MPAKSLRGDGLVVSMLLAAAAAGWLFLGWAVMDMSHPLSRLMMPATAAWDLPVAAAVYAMWSVMMAAMMLPSAVPMVLVVARLGRHGGATMAAGFFTAAYVLMWAGFSLLAAVAQWALQAAGLVSPDMASTSPALTAALLLAAGAYQFTPAKGACLTRCRSPVAFVMAEWRRGRAGAFVMGLRHGLFCVGCCWALMTVLFVTGVMNLPLVALLALAVALEKMTPWGGLIARATGAVLLAAGAWTLLGPAATGMADL